MNYIHYLLFNLY